MTGISKRKFGRTALSVTDMGFGAAPIGNFLRPISEDESHAMVERAWNAGPLTWNRRSGNGAWELSGLSPMHLWMQGNLLVISNSASLLDRMTAPDNRLIVGSGAYLAGYRHSQENANYGRMMRHIDNPQIPQTENGNPRAPMLFSENLAGIGRILQRVDTATLETKDDGAMLRQTVTYRKRP